jgi:DNA-3-methyladenine glycosylase
MFEAGGRLYVYFTYGMHYAVNIVTGRKGVGEAVLLRSAEPIEGLYLMMANRRTASLTNIASGPGKLAQALGIRDTKLSGEKLNKLSIYLEPPAVKIPAKDIVASPRVGITKAVDVPWRFYLKGSPFISKAVYNKPT